MARYLIDTNLLLRSLEIDHPQQKIADEAISKLFEKGENLCIVPQNIYEIWNVCTRPIERNGLGLTDEMTAGIVSELEKDFSLYPDVSEIYQQWKILVARYKLHEVKVHDTRLVAACLVHGLTHILTFNTSDFKRFQEITVIPPEDVI